jgi:hypothetical protein
MFLSASLRRGMPAAGCTPLPPLAVGRGRGWGALAKVHGVADNLNHAFDVSEHIIVPEAKHAVAVGLEVPCPSLIACAVGMLAAIDFDDDPRPVKCKVREIRTNRRLPAKVRALRRKLPKILPFFSIGRVVTKFARARYAVIDWPRCSMKHRPPTPAPSPPRAGGGEQMRQLLVFSRRRQLYHAAPPASVCTQASPQALASSRTRMM